MIYEKVLKLVSEQFGTAVGELDRETSFVDDLGADSLDVVELSMTIEESFKLNEISEEDLKEISSIGDLVDYVERVTIN